MLASLNKLNSNFKTLKEHVRSCHDIVIQQQKEINTLRANSNKQMYLNDGLEQYGRRESIRLHNVTRDLGDDAVDIVLDVVNQIDVLTPADNFGNRLNINLTRADIHRCHFLGDSSKETRKVICRFTSSAWEKRTMIMLNKKIVNKVREGKYGRVFVSEDLTSTRAGMMWYLKKNHATRFDKVHTRNGTLKFVDNEDLDKDGNPKWQSVDSPDDLHEILGDGLDIDELNKGFRDSCQVLKDLPMPVLPEIPDFTLDIDTDSDDNDTSTSASNDKA